MIEHEPQSVPEDTVPDEQPNSETIPGNPEEHTEFDPAFVELEKQGLKPSKTQLEYAKLNGEARQQYYETINPDGSWSKKGKRTRANKVRETLTNDDYERAEYEDAKRPNHPNGRVIDQRIRAEIERNTELIAEQRHRLAELGEAGQEAGAGTDYEPDWVSADHAENQRTNKQEPANSRSVKSDAEFSRLNNILDERNEFHELPQHMQKKVTGEHEQEAWQLNGAAMKIEQKALLHTLKRQIHTSERKGLSWSQQDREQAIVEALSAGALPEQISYDVAEYAEFTSENYQDKLRNNVVAEISKIVGTTENAQKSEKLYDRWERKFNDSQSFADRARQGREKLLEKVSGYYDQPTSKFLKQTGKLIRTAVKEQRGFFKKTAALTTGSIYGLARIGTFLGSKAVRRAYRWGKNSLQG